MIENEEPILNVIIVEESVICVLVLEGLVTVLVVIEETVSSEIIAVVCLIVKER